MSILRVVMRNHILWPIYRAGQISNYCMSAVLIACQWPSSPLKLQGILPHPWLRMSKVPHLPFLSLNISCMWDLCLFHVWGFYMYVCKYIWLFSLVNLHDVDLIIRPAKQTLKGWGKLLFFVWLLFGFFSLPYSVMAWSLWWPATIQEPSRCLPSHLIRTKDTAITQEISTSLGALQQELESKTKY